MDKDLDYMGICSIEHIRCLNQTIADKDKLIEQLVEALKSSDATYREKCIGIKTPLKRICNNRKLTDKVLEAARKAGK